MQTAKYSHRETAIRLNSAMNTQVGAGNQEGSAADGRIGGVSVKRPNGQRVCEETKWAALISMPIPSDGGNW